MGSQGCAGTGPSPARTCLLTSFPAAGMGQMADLTFGLVHVNLDVLPG